MYVEHLDASLIRDWRERIAAARRAASQSAPESREGADDAAYWQDLFERNAAAVLGVLPRVRLAAGHAVRYRFYGRAGNDLRVRPFITRAGTDAGAMLRLLDWYPAPDARPPAASATTQDADLLYRHFTIEPTATGAFEYWLAMPASWRS